MQALPTVERNRVDVLHLWNIVQQPRRENSEPKGANGKQARLYLFSAILLQRDVLHHDWARQLRQCLRHSGAPANALARLQSFSEAASKTVPWASWGI